MITTLQYTFESDNSNNYLMYLVNPTDLPSDIGDEINSLALSLSGYKLQLNSTSNTMCSVGEYVFNKLQELLNQSWDLERLGLPMIKLSGDMPKHFDNALKQRPVLLFVTGNNDKASAVKYWLKAVPSVIAKPFTFLGNYYNGFDIVTQDYNFVYNWLTKYDYMTSSTLATIKYDFDNLQTQWYKDECAAMLVAAKYTLDKFILDTNDNVYIPEYLIVPSYHVKRFKKAQSIINGKYHPDLVMTLPLLNYGTIGTYQILFPYKKG